MAGDPPRRRTRPLSHPAVRLSPRDRAYLQDFVAFGFLNHIVAAEAFRRAYAEPDAAAAKMRQQVQRLSEEDAAEEAARLNDGARVQTIMVARLVSEYAAAIEDLAGMVYAAGARDQGVMRAYLASEPNQTGAVLADVDGGVDLFDLFRLPDPASVPGMPDDLRDLMTRSLDGFTTTLRQIGAAARGAPIPEGTKLADVEPDRMVLILDVGEPTRTPPRGVLFQAHNRIKHRFMVVEHLERLGEVPDEPIRFAHVPRDPAVIHAVVSNITQVSLAAAEIAALLLTWDEAAHGSGAPD